MYKFIYQDVLKIASRDKTIRILKIFCRVLLILLIYQKKSKDLDTDFYIVFVPCEIISLT